MKRPCWIVTWTLIAAVGTPPAMVLILLLLYSFLGLIPDSLISETDWDAINPVLGPIIGFLETAALFVVPISILVFGLRGKLPGTRIRPPQGDTPS